MRAVALGACGLWLRGYDLDASQCLRAAVELRMVGASEGLGEDGDVEKSIDKEGEGVRFE